ncbi:MAG: hypothetical protein AAFQ07_01650 [Chloroflexota bacterium]
MSEHSTIDKRIIDTATNLMLEQGRLPLMILFQGTLNTVQIGFSFDLPQDHQQCIEHLVQVGIYARLELSEKVGTLQKVVAMAQANYQTRQAVTAGQAEWDEEETGKECIIITQVDTVGNYAAKIYEVIRTGDAVDLLDLHVSQKITVTGNDMVSYILGGWESDL